MMEYETIFILDPATDERTVEDEIAKITEVIRSDGGEIVEVEKWGRRRLAYEIHKRKEGIYTLIRHKCGPKALTEITRRFGINESILRHATMFAEGPTRAEAEAAEAAALARAAANDIPGSHGGPGGFRTDSDGPGS
jgi:small subunit ribosomal protein S6